MSSPLLEIQPKELKFICEFPAGKCPVLITFSISVVVDVV